MTKLVAPRARVQPVEFSDEVAALLRASGLPLADAGASQVQLLGCRQSRRLTGIVGIELYGSVGLLRSLAVAESSRGRGLGQALVARAEKVAARSGVRTLYLLTTTATDFFSRLGYAPAPRDLAPASIAATTQFTDICPASAAFLSKPLRLPAAPNRRTLPT
jgi:amino-acid N-acetyltransferase